MPGGQNQNTRSLFLRGGHPTDTKSLIGLIQRNDGALYPPTVLNLARGSSIRCQYDCINRVKTAQHTNTAYSIMRSRRDQPHHSPKTVFIKSRVGLPEEVLVLAM